MSPDAGLDLLPTVSFADVTSTQFSLRAGWLANGTGNGGCPTARLGAPLRWRRDISHQCMRRIASACSGRFANWVQGRVLLGSTASTCVVPCRTSRRLNSVRPQPRFRRRGDGRGRFCFALNAVVWGVDHANCVQPGIEYDPSPPFNRGLSEKADATTIARYRARVAKLTWDRQA